MNTIFTKISLRFPTFELLSKEIFTLICLRRKINDELLNVKCGCLKKLQAMSTAYFFVFNEMKSQINPIKPAIKDEIRMANLP